MEVAAEGKRQKTAGQTLYPDDFAALFHLPDNLYKQVTAGLKTEMQSPLCREEFIALQAWYEDYSDEVSSRLMETVQKLLGQQGENQSGQV